MEGEGREEVRREDPLMLKMKDWGWHKAGGGMALGWAADSKGRAFDCEDSLEDTTAHAQHSHNYIILVRGLEAVLSMLWWIRRWCFIILQPLLGSTIKRYNYKVLVVEVELLYTWVFCSAPHKNLLQVQNLFKNSIFTKHSISVSRGF